MKAKILYSVLLLFCSLPVLAIDTSIVEAVELADDSLNNIQKPASKNCDEFQWKLKSKKAVSKMVCLKIVKTKSSELSGIEVEEKFCPAPHYNWGNTTSRKELLNSVV